MGNRIPIEVASHCIPLIHGSKPVKQRQRPMNPRLELLVRKELEKLIRAGFIQPVELTTWVSPMVIVRKKNGKLRVCIDYRALNKVTIKDHFSLPFINNILEEVACHAMYSFADGYSGYNQIHVVQGDWYKTAFTTPWGTFIYIVMPFGLCNAPATFQRAMTYIFAYLLHKSMAVFIDDFCVHGSKESHFEDLRTCFERCRISCVS